MTPPTTISSSITNGIEVNGSLFFGGDLFFDGKLSGGNILGGKLTVGENATIDANVEVESIVIAGTVNGKVTVADRCELKSGARLIGDLTTSRFVMGDGATFIGASQITPRGTKPAAK